MVPHFFVCSIEKIIACRTSAKENYYFLTKYSHKSQARATERCTSLPKFFERFRQNPSKIPVKKLNLQNNFTTHDLLRKWCLKFPERFFSPIYRSLFVSYTAEMFCTFIQNCKRYCFALLLFLR